LVNHIVRNCGVPASLIGFAAPTHKAAKVLSASTGQKVNTIHSDLGLRLDFTADKFDVNHPPFNPKTPPKIENYQIYFVDEASMLGYSHRHLLESMAAKSNTRIIYCGDAYQLPPPEETYSSAFRGVQGWTLEEVVRQSADNPIMQILIRLRNDIKGRTFTALQYLIDHPEQWSEDGSKGYKVCNTNEEFEELVKDAHGSDEFKEDTSLYKTLSFTNDRVNSLNTLIRKAVVGDDEVLCINDLLTSYTTIVDKFLTQVITNSEDYIVTDVENFYKEGYGKGYLAKFQAVYGGERVSVPLFILDHRDSETLRTFYKNSYDRWAAAMTAPKGHQSSFWVEFYNYQRGALCLIPISSDAPAIGKQQFFSKKSIDYGFALTVHKSQGSTYEHGFTDAMDIVFDKYNRPYFNAENTNRLLYVACSRVRSKLIIRYKYK
jgi:exodeoxyribonuclease-5